MAEPLSEPINSVERGPGGKFLPGHRLGRPRGSKNRLNADVLDALGDLSSHALAVLKEKLGQHDLKAALYILDRFLPSERSVAVGSTDPAAVADALADGLLTPTEAGKAASAIATLANVAEVKELRDRLDEIEALIAAGRK
jgi:hypothetical protein